MFVCACDKGLRRVPHRVFGGTNGRRDCTFAPPKGMAEWVLISMGVLICYESRTFLRPAYVIRKE